MCSHGDTLVVLNINHLAPNLKVLKHILKLLEKKNIRLISHKENLDTESDMSDIQLEMIYSLCDFEKMNLSDLQATGILRAKNEKRYKGRASISYKNLGISRPTLDKLLIEYQQYR